MTRYRLTKLIPNWRFAVLSVSLLYVLFLILSPVVAEAQAAPEPSGKAQFVDKNVILYDGREWRDRNPYDNTWEYKAGPQSGVDGCGSNRHTFGVRNPDNDNPTGWVNIYYQDESGDCKTAINNNVEFKREGLEKRFWNVYRRSANELYVPTSTYWDLGNCGAQLGPTQRADKDFIHNPPEAETYERNSDRDPPNEYFEKTNILEENNKIRTNSDATGSFVIKGRCTNGGFRQTGNKTINGIVIAYEGQAVNGAERCIPRFYGVNSGGCEDGDTSDPTEPPANDDNSDNDDSEPTCEENFDFTGAWIVCMALGIIDQTVDNMVDAIADMLSVGKAEINDDGLKTAWSYFRNIASVLLVVIGLVMIIGQAVSKE